VIGSGACVVLPGEQELVLNQEIDLRLVFAVAEVYPAFDEEEICITGEACFAFLDSLEDLNQLAGLLKILRVVAGRRFFDFGFSECSSVRCHVTSLL